MTQYSLGSHDMVAHVWAQQNQSHGYVTSQRMFFEGKTIYSYGKHFVLGHFIDDSTVLLNSDSYSVSTSKHKTIVWRAVSHIDGFDVPGLTDLVRYDFAEHAVISNIRENWRVYKPYIVVAEKLLKFAKSRKSARKIIDIEENKHARKQAKRNRETVKKYLSELRRICRIDKTNLHKFPFNVEVLYNDTFSTCDFNISGDFSYRSTLSRFKNVASMLRKMKKATNHLLSDNQKRKILDRIADCKKATERIENERGVIIERQKLRETIRKFRAIESLWHDSSVRYNGIIADCEKLLQSAKIPSIVKSKIQMIFDWSVARRKELQYRENVKRLKKEKFDRENWLNGENNRFYGRTMANGYYIRAENIERDSGGNIVNGILRTTGYATCPLTHAIKAFKIIKRCKENNVSWVRNGKSIHVGHFQIDKIDSTGNIHAGCHFIEWSEIERLSRQLGIMK